MARTPVYTQSIGLDTDRGGMPSPRFDKTLAGNLQDFGGALSNYGIRAQQIKDQKEEFNAAIEADKLDIQLEESFQQRKSQMPEDGEGLHDNFMQQDFETKANAFLSSLPERLREKYAGKIEVGREKWSYMAAKDQRDQLHNYYRTQLNENANGLLIGIDRNPGDYDNILAHGEELIDQSGLTPVEKETLKRTWKDTAQLALANRIAQDDPEGAQRLLGGKAATGGAPADTKDLIRKKEGFRATPYWDVNAYRVGYGSDTITRADGSVVRVKQGMRVTREDAERDLDRRIKEFERASARQVSTDAWAKLPSSARAALTSVAYNYGSLPGGVVRAVRSGDLNAIAKSVEGLAGHNGGVNRQRRMDEAALIRSGSNATGVEKPVQYDVDPRFADMPYDQRLKALALADKTIADRQAAQDAQAKQVYAQIRDGYDLAITQGATSEDAILADPVLDDGDKASLIRKYRTAEGDRSTASDYSARLADPNAQFNPYSTDDRKGVGLAYDNAVQGKSIYDEDGTARQLAAMIYGRTGIVPKAVVNEIRAGLVSGDANRMAQSAAFAAGLAGDNPGALSANENGEELAKAATTWRHMTDTLGLSPDEAGKRMADMSDPEKRKAREALLETKAVKDTLKKVDDGDVADIFDKGLFDFAPDVGATDAAKAVMVSDYKAMLEESIVEAGGDMDLAKKYAAEKFRRSHGVSDLTLDGDNTVVKYPPEVAYPVGPDGSFAYIRVQAEEALKAEGIEPDKIYLQPYDETAADIRAGRPARYMLYYERDGFLNMYNLPFYAEPELASEVLDLSGNRSRRDSNMAKEQDRQRMIETFGKPGQTALDSMTGQAQAIEQQMQNVPDAEPVGPVRSGGGGF